MEQNEDEDKDNDIEFTKYKKDPENEEIAIDFRLSDVQKEGEEDNGQTNFIENLQKLVDEENFKKLTEWLFDDCDIVPNE